MKKLLLGALLVVGATSFAAAPPVTTSPDTQQTLGLGNGTDAKTGSVSLNLVTSGEVVALAAGDYMLVINPTTNGGTDGRSIEFDFQNLTPGITREVQGGFVAKVIKGGTTDGTGQGTTDKDTDVKLNDNQKATFSTLFNVNGTETDAESVSIVVNDVVSKEKLGDLTYSVTAGFASDSINYEGIVKAKVTVPSDADSGSFMDNSVDVVVKVTGLKADPAQMS